MNTIKNLCKKEWHLSLKNAIFIYIYALLGVLLLAPNYPYCTAFMYCVIGIAVLFGNYKGNKDLEFTAILPVKRTDIVKSKFIAILFIELIQILIAIPFALLSAFIVNTNGNLVGTDANFTLFAFAFIEYSVFNIIFLPLFFKTGYKVGKPAFWAILAYVVTTLALEFVVAFVPSLNAIFDGYAHLGYQAILLVVSVALFVLSTYLAFKMSVKNFEKVNL